MTFRHRLLSPSLLFLALAWAPLARSAAPAAPDPKTDRLCEEAADPAAAPDKVHIHCRLERADFAPAPPKEAPEALTIVAYNLERGMHLDEQIDMFHNHPVLSHADVLLLSELDRGCARTGHRNVPRELAVALKMNYVFATEFTELPRGATDKAVNRNSEMCEHGNAIMSRFPLTEVEGLRHKATVSWYDRSDEPRLGGRIAVKADIPVGGAVLRAYSVHFESGALDNVLRSKQAREVVKHATDHEGPVVIGGDMNTGFYLADLKTGGKTDRTPPVYLKAGYADAHAALPVEKRITHGGEGLHMALDLLFTKGFTVQKSGVCGEPACTGLSDHELVWTTVTLP